jgi:ribulose-phosphate 3-epimerase
MSVNPGYSAQSFIPNVIRKISELDAIRKQYYPELQIEVDGGVNDTNSSTLINSGADILVSASFIFKSDNYSNTTTL